jgi:hypothetical protein
VQCLGFIGLFTFTSTVSLFRLSRICYVYVNSCEILATNFNGPVRSYDGCIMFDFTLALYPTIALPYPQWFHSPVPASPFTTHPSTPAHAPPAIRIIPALFLVPNHVDAKIAVPMNRSLAPYSTMTFSILVHSDAFDGVLEKP